MKRVLVLLVLAACSREKPHVAVGAAASLRTAMPDLVSAFESRGGSRVDVTFGSSDALAKQARAGAAFDALILADEGVLDPALVASRHVVAANPIVLVGPPQTDTNFARLASLPEADRIAIGDPKSVPVGRYARTYLQQLGSWDALQPRLVLGGDAAGVLALALKGTTRVAIVYRSDAAQAAPLVILDAPARAPVAHITVDVLAHRDGAAFAAFLVSPEAQKILAAHQLAPP